ncbi:MAG: flagellar biosynthesis anti-sigma factor FlgM [Lachnospiraceae bacterium]
MKVTLNNATNFYANTANQAKRNPVGSTKSGASSFDSIMIQSDSVQIAEKQFSSSLSATLSTEIKQPTSSNKIDVLSEQVANGTYQVDANKIANKMYLMGREDMYV